MHGPSTETFTLDPLRAGCCARLTGQPTARYPAPTPCPRKVCAVGWVLLGQNRRALAFACRDHQGLRADPVRYGSAPGHYLEMCRRARRDRWLHAARLAGRSPN